VSHSFGYLTPGGVGSDVVRAYQVYSAEQQLLKVSSTLSLCAIIPIVFLLMLLPISVGGIGVREGILVVYSGFLGVPTEQAVLAGLSFYFFQIMMLLPGFAIAGSSALRQNS
jgi:hypothetical protein